MAIVVVASNNKDMPRLDPSVRRQLIEFLELVATDVAPPFEPIESPVDERMKIAPIGDSFAAVVAELGDFCVYLGTWPREDAALRARTATLRVTNGLPEAVLGELDGLRDRDKIVAIPDRYGEIRHLISGEDFVPAAATVEQLEFVEPIPMDAPDAVAATPDDDLPRVDQVIRPKPSVMPRHVATIARPDEASSTNQPHDHAQVPVTSLTPESSDGSETELVFEEAPPVKRSSRRARLASIRNAVATKATTLFRRFGGFRR